MKEVRFAIGETNNVGENSPLGRINNSS